jgi:hypothetical protein
LGCHLFDFLRTSVDRLGGAFKHYAAGSYRCCAKPNLRRLG